MMQKIKKPISILLSLLMVLSVFVVVPVTASAAATYTKDSAGIADGITLVNPGDTIYTSDTSGSLLFYSDITCDYSNDGTNVGVIPCGNLWSDVDSFSINDNYKYICSSYGEPSTFIPDDGKVLKVSYRSDIDLWIIAAVDPSAIPQTPVFYTKDSEGITDGIILDSATDMICTVNTSRILVFDCDVQCDYNNEGTSVFDIRKGDTWYDTSSFLINDNNDFLFINSGTSSKLTSGSGTPFKVSYDSSENKWHIIDGSEPVPLPDDLFVKVTSEDQVTEDNIGACTFSDAKEWVYDHWDEITNGVDDGYIDFDFVYVDSNDALGFTKTFGFYLNDICTKEMFKANCNSSYVTQFDSIKEFYSSDILYLCKVRDPEPATEAPTEAPTEASYTVTWKNWNGEELETDTNVAKDTLPSYDGEAPTRPDDANNTYTFAAWDDGTTTYMIGVDDLPPVTGDVTYTAVFTADPKTTEAPTEAPDTYIVAGNDTTIFGTSWNGNDTNNTMTFSNDIWSKEYTVDGAKKEVQLKAVKNGSAWIGDETGNNVTFNLSGAGTFTVYCDGAKTWVDGDIVTYDDGLTVESVTAVGNGTPDGDNWLNNIEWDPAASANHMTILSAGLYEIEYTLGDYDTSDPEFKFAINDAWTHNFGLADGGVIANGVETDAIYNGPQNIKITGLSSGTTIKMYLDLTEFNYETKTGAKMTITWTVPAQPTEAPTETPVVPIVYNLNDETANILWEDRCSIDGYWDIYVETDDINFLLGALNSAQAAGTYTWADLDYTACEIFVGDALTPYHFTDGSCTVTTDYNDVTVSGIFTCEDGNTYDLTFSTGRIYTVTWMNGDEILKIDTNLALGDIPAFSGETPVKPEDDDFTYEFIGWKLGPNFFEPDSLPIVDGDATYVAEFRSTPKYAAGYYIIGTMTDWKINDAYMLTPNNNIDFTEYMFEDFSINMGDMFKVVYAEAGKDKIWYPTGMGNNYGENGEFTTGGFYTVYFRPNSDGGEDWFYNCIYVVCTMTDAAMLVNGQINILPEAEDVTLNDKAAVEAARADYDALSDADKAFVDPDLLQKLTDVEDAIAAAEVTAMIDALPETITLDDKDDVAAARAAFKALTEKQQGMVLDDTMKKLTDAEDAIAAAEVSAMINALPAAEDVKLADKDAVKAAREAYNALTDLQKALIGEATEKKLTDDENAIADLEAAKTVENQINALPDVIIYDDKADVEAARRAYDALTDAQKALVDADTLQKLTDAEEALGEFFLLGDADGNGAVETIDITLIQRKLAHLNVPDTFNEKAADIDGDGELSVYEVTLIQRYLANLEVKYPIGEYVK